MGYNSSFEYQIANEEIEFMDLDKINSEIKVLESGMSTAEIVKYYDGYDIKMEEYYGKFYDDREFANILSKYLLKGSIELNYAGEDGVRWGYTVYPQKVVELEFIPVPVDLAKQVADYIKSITN
jgi:hypothetical protein